jgi:hypothetical protein
MFRHFVHFKVLVIDKYRYGENIFPRDVKFCPRTGNPTTAYQHLSLASSRTYITNRIIHCAKNQCHMPTIATNIFLYTCFMFLYSKRL